MTHLTAGPIPELPYANLILYLIKYHPSGVGGGGGEGSWGGEKNEGTIRKEMVMRRKEISRNQNNLLQINITTWGYKYIWLLEHTFSPLNHC